MLLQNQDIQTGMVGQPIAAIRGRQSADIVDSIKLPKKIFHEAASASPKAWDVQLAVVEYRTEKAKASRAPVPIITSQLDLCQKRLPLAMNVESWVSAACGW